MGLRPVLLGWPGTIMPCRYSICRTGNSARLEKLPFWMFVSESRMALGPVCALTPSISFSTMRPDFIRCFTLSAGQPQRMDSSASGIETQ